jgi:predicted nucleic acid-binding protein
MKAVDSFEIINFDGLASMRASRIYDQLKDAKSQAGLREIINAATCAAHEAALFTKNRQAYEGIKGLNFV